MSRKFVITIEDFDGHCTTKMEGKGWNPLELIGFIEQVKFELIKKANDSSEMASRPSNLADLLGRMKNGGGFDDLFGGLPPGIRRPKDDED